MTAGALLRGPGVGALFLLLLLTGCATGGWPWSGGAEEAAPEEAGSEVRAGDLLFSGVRDLEDGDYEGGTGKLHRLAARCRSGTHGRRAVLLLAATALDPRNGAGDPDRAAALAGHFLALEGAAPSERLVAETLYLLALDRGADAPDRRAEPEAAEADAPEWPAPRFRACDVPDSISDAPGSVVLPRLPDRPSAEVLSGARSERDSLRVRVRELEAELERIRALLTEGVPPDTSGVEPR